MSAARVRVSLTYRVRRCAKYHTQGGDPAPPRGHAPRLHAHYVRRVRLRLLPRVWPGRAPGPVPAVPHVSLTYRRSPVLSTAFSEGEGDPTSGPPQPGGVGQMSAMAARARWTGADPSSVTIRVISKPCPGCRSGLIQDTRRLELQTKVREDFTITKKAPANYLLKVVTTAFSPEP